MKIISFILAVIILMLAVTPCSDGETCDDQQVAMTFEHDHSQDHNDHCTPFCTCLCCGAHITSNEVIAFEILREDPNFEYSNFYSFDYSFDFLNAIWHPPTFS